MNPNIAIGKVSVPVELIVADEVLDFWQASFQESFDRLRKVLLIRNKNICSFENRDYIIWHGNTRCQTNLIRVVI